MNKKIYVYGTGANTVKFLNQQGDKTNIVGFVETEPRHQEFRGRKVYSIDELSDYDAVIVSNIYSDAIYKVAKNKGHDLNKFIFMYPGVLYNYGESIDFAKNILSEVNFTTFCASHKLYDDSFFGTDKELYSQLNTRDNFKINENDLHPIIEDKYEEMGCINDYFWQDLWAAKLIFKNAPAEHYDIGSRLDGFLAHILAMNIPLRVIDVRPFPQEIENMQTIVDDATEMKEFEDDSIESLSALCSLEHFGLGRYGDKVDPEACFKAFNNIQRKMKSGGKLYISVPIGRERVQFNAHRIFYASTIIKTFNQMKLIELSCSDGDRFEQHIDIHKYDSCEKMVYGLFCFEKK